jgi:hypothetical protein
MVVGFSWFNTSGADGFCICFTATDGAVVIRV